MRRKKLIQGAVAVLAVAAVAQVAGVGGTSGDTTPPATVDAPTANINDDGSVSLTWSASSDAESGIRSYVVQRDGTYLANASGTSYADAVVDAGRHTYRILAVNGAGMKSEPSSEAYARTVGTTSRATLKPIISGVLDRKGVPRDDLGGIVDSFVVDVNWSQLQTSRGAGLTQNNPIDQAVNAAKAKGYAVKLRVDVGGGAPAWAKQLGGAPFLMKNNDAGGDPTSLGRWWTPEYEAAYDRLQQLLAAKYDAMNVPVYDVAITGCSAEYSEPMVRSIGPGSSTTQYNLAQLKAAHFTTPLDIACFKASIDSHRKYWLHTRGSYAFNPLQTVIYNGTNVTSGTSLDSTYDVMTYCRQQLDKRCVIGNNSIQPERFNGTYQQMYDRIKSLGGAIYFQTANSSKLTDAEVWPTIDAFATQREGSSYVELNTEYGSYDRMRLRNVDSALEAQARSAG